MHLKTRSLVKRIHFTSFQLYRGGILGIIALLIISCSMNGKQDVQNIVVDIKKNDVIDLESRITIREIVQLDNQYPIGKITKSSISEDKIYVLDKQSEQIFGFKRNGEFLFVISDHGNGPNEYNHIYSFFIDQYNKKIKLISGTGKILLYDLDGKFHSVVKPDEERSFKKIMNGFQLDGTTEIHYGLGPKYNLAIYNSASKERLKFIPFIEARDVSFSMKAFSSCENSVLFCHGTNDSIYSLDTDGVNGKYYVDFKENKIVPAWYSENPQLVEEQYEKQVVAVKLDQLNETREKVLFSYWVFDVNNPDGVKTQYVVYNKSEQKVYNIGSESAFFPVNDVVDNQICASVIPPVKLIHSERKNQQLSEYLDQNKISEDQNPLVVLWEIE